MEDPIVQTENGLLRGCVVNSSEGYNYYSFRGIPYAKPPINELRLEDPVPYGKWSGVKDALNYGNIPLQFDFVDQKFNGDEDCLYLNVFTKSIKSNNLKPVMVWISGGGFIYDSGNDTHYGPDYLLRKDIVFVTFNYRLGVLGFLNLEDEVSQGNMGMKDMVMVLQWVKTNIEHFDGDPNNVTVFGESAGGIAAHYLALSPMSKGLFHKMICQSNTGFSIIGKIHNPKKYAFQLCTLLGKYSTDSREMFNFLKNVDSRRLIQAQEKVRRSTYMDRFRISLAFTLSIDDMSPNPFFKIPFEEAASNGVDIPSIIGYNTSEGVVTALTKTTPGCTMFSNEDFSYLDRNFEKAFTPERLQLLKSYNLTPNDLKYMYFKNEKICFNNCRIYAELLGDLLHTESIHKTAKIQVEKNSAPLYLYKFSFDEEVTLNRSFLNINIPGAYHFDEVEFLFYYSIRKKMGLEPIKKNSSSYKVMLHMTELWTNFATYGNPTPAPSKIKWEPVDDAVHLKCLNINKELKTEIITNIEKQYKSSKSKNGVSQEIVS